MACGSVVVIEHARIQGPRDEGQARVLGGAGPARWVVEGPVAVHRALGKPAAA